MYVCVCVFVCTYMYVCMYVRTYVCMYVCMYTRVWHTCQTMRLKSKNILAKKLNYNQNVYSILAKPSKTFEHILKSLGEKRQIIQLFVYTLDPCIGK